MTIESAKLDAGERRERGLAALLADVLEGERPPAEWLVRYARDPGSLAGAERKEVEWHLAHTPGYRSELGVLRRFLGALVAPQG